MHWSSTSSINQNTHILKPAAISRRQQVTCGFWLRKTFDSDPILLEQSESSDEKRSLSQMYQEGAASPLPPADVVELADPSTAAAAAAACGSSGWIKVCFTHDTTQQIRKKLQLITASSAPTGQGHFFLDSHQLRIHRFLLIGFVPEGGRTFNIIVQI